MPNFKTAKDLSYLASASDIETAWTVIFTVLTVTFLLAVIFLPSLLRRRALARLAQGLGFSFSGEDNRLWKSPFTEFPLFKRGAGWRRIRNVMQGVRDGREILLFDYELTRSRGTFGDIVVTPDIVYTVAAFQVREGTLPNFQIGPRTILESLFHRTDPVVETQPEFAERYAVRGAPPQELRSLLRPEFLDALVSSNRTWYLEGGGDWLITYATRVKPIREEILTFVDQAEKFVRELDKALQLREISVGLAEGPTLGSVPRAEAATVLGKPKSSRRISWWRDPGLWAAVLSLVGLWALLRAFSVCDQGNERTSSELAGQAFQTALGALAVEVAALALSIRGLRRPGMRLLAALGLLIEVLVLLGGLLVLFLSIAGFCSNALL
jgi:hypothetical protein